MESFSWQGRDDDGNKVVYEASHFGGWWQLTCTPKVGRSRRDEVEAEQIEFTEDLWQELRELLWRKYQRRRVAWDMVQHIDDILAGKARNERRDRR
ncbi:MAG: hypothetical protein IJB31_05015 [Akkermansia sp.]|nr:hypothetical protein [Akkermansia sp.]